MRAKEKQINYAEIKSFDVRCAILISLLAIVDTHESHCAFTIMYRGCRKFFTPRGDIDWRRFSAIQKFCERDFARRRLRSRGTNHWNCEIEKRLGHVESYFFRSITLEVTSEISKMLFLRTTKSGRWARRGMKWNWGTFMKSQRYVLVTFQLRHFLLSGWKVQAIFLLLHFRFLLYFLMFCSKSDSFVKIEKNIIIFRNFNAKFGSLRTYTVAPLIIFVKR